MVDGIVANLLSYDINFANGNTPNLFKRHWTDRLNGVSAVYNYPADAVYVEFGDVAGDIKRKSTGFARPSMMRKLSDAMVFPEKKEKSAVLFITCQNEFLDGKGKLYSKVKDAMKELGTKNNLKELHDAATDSDALIIHAPVEIKTGDTYKTTGFDEFKLSQLDDMFVPVSFNEKFYILISYTTSKLIFFRHLLSRDPGTLSCTKTFQHVMVISFYPQGKAQTAYTEPVS